MTGKTIFIEERAITKYNGQMIARGSRRVFLRPEVKRFEMAIRYAASKQFEGPPLEGKLKVDIDFHFDNNRMPDLFNLPKAVCDALNKLVWVDDRQIYIGTLTKVNDGKNFIKITINQIIQLDPEGKMYA